MENKKTKKFVEDNFELDNFKETTFTKIKKRRNDYNNKFLNKLSYLMIIISFISVYILYNFFNSLIMEKNNVKTSLNESLQHTITYKI